MIHRSISDLHLVTSRDPMPTVEIQAESLEVQGLMINEIVSSALTRFAADNPTCTATIYMLGTMSVNFHVAAWSEFLIAAGDQKVLQVLGSAFSRLPDVQSRFSDYIAPRQGNEAFHVEDGLLWRPEDAVTWYSASPESVEEEPVSANDTIEADETSKDDLNDLDDWGDVILETELAEEADDTPSGGRTPEQPARYRAARSDAKVARICQRIEEVFGLPEGSVALCGPDGRALRGDALIKTLRNRWDRA